MARRLTINKLATYKALSNEIEERCYDVQQFYEEYVILDEEDAPFDLKRFYLDDEFNVVIVLRNWEARDLEIKVPNEIFILPYNRFVKRLKEHFNKTISINE
jgi:hypothetical protein